MLKLLVFIAFCLAFAAAKPQFLAAPISTAYSAYSGYTPLAYNNYGYSSYAPYYGYGGYGYYTPYAYNRLFY